MKKKIISLILALVFVFTMTVSASASELPSTDGAIPIVLVQDDIEDTGDELVAPCSLSLPTEYHNLREGSYSVTLTEVGSNRLYTNKTFRPDSNQRLYITVNVKAKKDTTTFKIGYYDITAGKDFGLPYTIENLTTSGTSITIYAFEMNPSHEYAIYFISNGAVATGSGTVFHGA